MGHLVIKFRDFFLIPQRMLLTSFVTLNVFRVFVFAAGGTSSFYLVSLFSLAISMLQFFF